MIDPWAPESEAVFQTISAAIRRGEQPGSQRSIAEASRVPIAKVGEIINALADVGHILKFPTPGKYTPTEYGLPENDASQAAATRRAEGSDAPLAGRRLVNQQLPEEQGSEAPAADDSTKHKIRILQARLFGKELNAIEAAADDALETQYQQLRQMFNARVQGSTMQSYRQTVLSAVAIWADLHPDHPQAISWNERHPDRPYPLPVPTCPQCGMSHDPVFIDTICPACQESL